MVLGVFEPASDRLVTCDKLYGWSTDVTMLTAVVVVGEVPALG